MVTTDVKLILNKFWKWHYMGMHNGLLRPPLYHHGGTPLAGEIMAWVHLIFFVQGQEGRTQKSRFNIQRPVVLHHRKVPPASRSQHYDQYIKHIQQLLIFIPKLDWNVSAADVCASNVGNWWHILYYGGPVQVQRYWSWIMFSTGSLPVHRCLSLAMSNKR